jgi:membrane protease YdiL (CAAX protease family)
MSVPTRRVTSSSDWLFIGVVFALTLAVNVLDFWVHGFTHLLCSYAAAAGMGVAAYMWGLRLADVGLSPKQAKSGLKWGTWSVLVIGTALVIAYLVSPGAFADHRYQTGWSQAARTIFVTIPFATVLFEEFVFRGVMLAALNRKFRLRWAVVLSSLAFGLWHIVTSLHIYASSNELGSATAALGNAQLLSIVATVAVTALAGVAFCYLRLRSKSLITPILAHWALNAGSVFLIALAFHTR